MHYTHRYNGLVANSHQTFFDFDVPCLFSDVNAYDATFAFADIIQYYITSIHTIDGVPTFNYDTLHEEDGASQLLEVFSTAFPTLNNMYDDHNKLCVKMLFTSVDFSPVIGMAYKAERKSDLSQPG